MEMEGEIKAAKRESMVRKGLSDITNSPMAFKILVEDSKLSQAAEITRAYVDQLLQDKKELVKQLEERNKIIELNGMELQRLRGSYQKTQFQNWNLAQSNSQMLAELNIGKEKLKSLQHELACKNALLRAKSLELERNVAENSVKVAKQEAARKEDDKIKTFNRSNRRHQRSQSLGVSNFKQEATKVENKRHCVRRQSARFVSQECEPAAEKLFEIEETKFPLRKSLQTLMGELSPSSNDDKENDNSCSSRPERASIGERRPSRRAAEKVQSYKETPVNVKMRRER